MAKKAKAKSKPKKAKPKKLNIKDSKVKITHDGVPLVPDTLYLLQEPRLLSDAEHIFYIPGLSTKESISQIRFHREQIYKNNK